MKKNFSARNPGVIIICFGGLLLLAWAPWMNSQAVHDMVLHERAHKDGTMGWVTMSNGTQEYMLICDYNVMWVPFGRWVASCEGAYFVPFFVVPENTEERLP